MSGTVRMALVAALLGAAAPGRADDAVDARSGSASYQDRQLVLHSLSPAANDSFSLAFNSMTGELDR